MTDKQQRESPQKRFSGPTENSPSPGNKTKIPANRMVRAPEQKLAFDSVSGMTYTNLLRAYLMEECRKSDK